MSRELTRYKKKVAGLRSKIISMERKGRVSYRNNMQCAMEDTTTKIKACNKCTQTDMLDVRKALSQVEEETDRDMCDGIRYYGMCNKKKLTSGYIESYARISSSQPNSSVNPKTLRERAKLSFDIMGIISGGRFCDDGERHILAVKLIKTNFLFFQRAAEDAGILRERTISVKDALGIKALSQLSMNKIRDLRVSLTKLGCTVWPSESKIKMADTLETRHVVGTSVVESGLMALKPMATSEHTEMLPFVRVSTLLQFIADIFENVPSEQDPSSFNNEIWILFAGDKGGGNVKMHVEIINSISCGSVDNVHLYYRFE